MYGEWRGADADAPVPMCMYVEWRVRLSSLARVDAPIITLDPDERLSWRRRRLIARPAHS